MRFASGRLAKPKRSSPSVMLEMHSAAINQDLAGKEAEVVSAGYAFVQHEGSFYWDTGFGASEDFYDRADAVESAYKNHQARTQNTEQR